MIVERVKSMRLYVRFFKYFWADAMNTIAYLLYRGSLVPLDGRLSKEAWTRK